jgi:hypothetical protein
MKTKTKREIEIYEDGPYQEVVYVKQQSGIVEKIGIHRILILVACALFMFAYAGIDIGILMGVAIPMYVLIWIAVNVWKRWGYWYAVWVGGFATAVFAYTWGMQFINFMTFLFASIQKVSVAGMIVTGVLFLLTLKK